MGIASQKSLALFRALTLAGFGLCKGDNMKAYAGVNGFYPSPPAYTNVAGITTRAGASLNARVPALTAPFYTHALVSDLRNLRNYTTAGVGSSKAVQQKVTGQNILPELVYAVGNRGQKGALKYV